MLIELSRFNTNSAFSNADYINTIPPLTIQQGGSLMFNSGFLDYATATPENVIEIPEDTTITLSCGFYMCLWFEFDKAPSTEAFVYSNVLNVRPFELYTARNPSTYLPVISTRSFVLPKGNYSPFEIQNIINENLIQVPQTIHGSGADFVSDASQQFIRSTMIGEAVANSVNLQGEPTPIIYFNINLKDKTQLGTPENPRFKVGDSVKLYDVIANVDIQFYKAGTHPSTWPSSVVINEVDFNNGILWYSGGWNYTTENSDEEYPDLVSVIVYKTNTEAVVFVSQAPNSVHNGETFYMANESVMGATQMALEYNNNNNALFQFTYLHTPFYHSSNESIAIYGSGRSNYFDSITSQSGVFFTQMEPRTFWEDTLGFDVDSMVMTYDPSLTTPTNRNFTQPLKAGVNITSNFLGNDILINKGDFDTFTPMRQLQRNVYFNESTQTIPIKALRQIGIKSSNFYLVELNGLDLINMENDTQFFRTICAIGSKEYSNLGVISLYGTGMPFYVNNGVSDVVLTNLRVRILDSLTKQPSTTLGEKNSIFIEYQPPVQISPQLPPPAEEKPKKRASKKAEV
jgi:hypothetical protein